MKLHYLPLVLCFLFATISFGNNAIITDTDRVESTFFADYEEVTILQTDRSLPQKAVPNTNSNTQKVAPITVEEVIQPVSGDMEVLNQASVFSYKNSDNAIEASAINFSAGSFGLGLYYGFAGMVILLNLICFLIFSEKVFLYYGIASAAIIALFVISDGITGLEMASDPIFITSLLFVIVTGCSAVFSNKYLKLKEFFPKASLVGGILLGIAGLMALGGLITSELTLALISRIVSFTVLLSFFTAGVILFNKKNYAKFYVIGVSIPLLFIMDYFILAPNGIYFLGVEAIHLKIASVVELLILSYAIVYRMQAIKDEIVLRQTEMRIFLKRQEAMTRQSVERLMEDMYLENLIMHYDLDGIEIKLLQYISEGKENTKIARKLKISEEDVEELTKELYHKLEISEHIQEDYRMVDSQPDYIYN